MLNMDNFLKEVDYALDILHKHSKSAYADKILTNDEKKQSEKGDESKSHGRSLCSSIV